MGATFDGVRYKWSERAPSEHMTPFRGFLRETWGRTSLPQAALLALCSIVETMGDVPRDGVGDLKVLFKTLKAAIVEDRLCARVAAFLEAKGDLPLWAATCLWRFQQCSKKGRHQVLCCLSH